MNINEPLHDDSRVDFEHIIKKFHQDYFNHIDTVRRCIDILINKNAESATSIQDIVTYQMYMKTRALNHDKSKLFDFDEFNNYIMMTAELKGVEYGTDKHKEITDKYKIAINRHYDSNDHHPEHFEHGILDMDKYQLDEMICDWTGSMISRNVTDKMDESLEFNKKRFHINDETYKYIYDTIKYIINKYKK